MSWIGCAVCHLALRRVGFGECVETYGISRDLMRRQPHSGDDRDPAIGRRHGIGYAFVLVAPTQQSLLRIQHAPGAEGLSVRVIPGDEGAATREPGGVRVFSDLLARVEQPARGESLSAVGRCRVVESGAFASAHKPDRDDGATIVKAEARPCDGTAVDLPPVFADHGLREGFPAVLRAGDDDVAVHRPRARHGSITEINIGRRVDLQIRPAAFTDVGQNAAVARKCPATIRRNGQPYFRAAIFFLFIALVNPGDVDAAPPVHGDGLEGVTGGLARAVRVDSYGGREGLAAVGRARETNVTLPFPALVCPADVYLAPRADGPLRRILIANSGVARAVIDPDWRGKIRAVGRMTQHHVADAVGAFDVSQVEPPAIVRNNKRVVLAVAGRGRAVLMRLRPRHRGGDQHQSNYQYSLPHWISLRK